MGIVRLLGCLPALAMAGLAGQRVAAQAPHLSDRISVSVRQGTIAADLELSRLPPLTNARRWLHTGLNVEAFRDSTGRSILAQRRSYAPDTTEEAWQYQLLDAQNRPRPLPPRLRLRYAGAFPVQADSGQYPDRGDDKGRFAFNGQTVRATEQTAWYPILYDRALDQEISAYTYDLGVSCADCQTLYLNGSAPAAGPVQRLVSTTPVALVLFAGNSPVQRFTGGWLLNSALTAGQAATFGGFVGRVRGYYERQLGPKYYREKLAAYRRLLRHGNFAALSATRQAGDLDDAYRYVAAPLQLLALERLVGEKQVWRWLRAVVQSAAPRTDYAFLLDSLRRSGLREADLTAWLSRYTGGGPAMQQALLALTLP